MVTDRAKGTSILVRILVAFLLVNALTSSVLLVIIYAFGTATAKEHAEEAMAQQIAVLSDRFDHQYRDDLDRTLRWLAASSLLDDYLFASRAERLVAIKRIETLFKQTVRDFPSFAAVRFIDYLGQVEIGAFDGRHQRERLDLTAVDLDGAGPVVRGMHQLYQRLESTPLLLSSGNMEWFMPPREPHIVGPFLDADGSVSALAGIAKLDLDTAEFGGVVVVHFRLDEMLANLRDVTFFGENPVWVLDAHGEILQRPGDDETTLDPTSLMDEAFQATPVVLSVESGLVAYQDFSLAPGSSFIRVVSAVPTKVLHRDMERVMRLLAIVLVTSLGIVLVASLYVSRYLSRPIVELAGAAARLAKGDLETRVDVRATGEVQTLVESFNRMTDDLRASSAARDLSVESLEREVADRERAQQELRQRARELTEARIAAEAADRAKGEFLASMSHEIRTPINGVLGMTELLANTELDVKQGHLVDNARRSVLALLDVINDILDFSKIEAGKLELLREDFDLRALVEDVGQMLAPGAQRKGIELVCGFPPDIATGYHGDPARVRQVLTNLLANAIKFTHAGEVVVDLELRALQDGAIELRFEVRDTGIGIPEEAHSLIFEAFSQADGSTTRRYGGTGLGLGICRRLTELMGGTIGVRSIAGAGSTFWFTVLVEGVASSASPPAHDAATLEGRRVLVVDDNASSRTVLERQLGAWDMQCECAPDGVIALGMLRQAADDGNGFDLVLLDAHMPMTTGPDLAAALAATPDWSALPIVMAFSIGDDQAALLGDAPVAASVTKPIRAAALRRALDVALLGARESTGDASAEADRDTPLEGRVLIAEDNEINQEMAARMVELLGCDAVVVCNGAEAVEAIASTDFDLVLMDCQMPVMDGYTAVGRIRDRESGDRRVPVVALTANALRGQRERCLDAGMDDLLTKPFTFDQFAELLRRWLPAARGPAPAAVPAGGFDRRAASSESEGTVLDGAALANLRLLQRGDSEDVLERFRSMYVETGAALLTELHEAIGAADAERVNAAAHTLKSATANVGGRHLAELCKQLEDHAARGELDTAAGLLDTIEEAHLRVCAALGAACGRDAA